MDPTTQAFLAALIGAGVAGGAVLAWHVSDRQQHQPTAAPVEPAVPASVAAVLSVLRSSAVIVDDSDVVLKASAPAYAMALVRGTSLASAELAALVSEVRRDGQIRETELVMPRAHAPARHVTVRVAPLGSRLVLALVEDRTRERRVESVRRDFVANVSHELKTPVGAIRLLADAVHEAADDPDAVRRFSDRMVIEGERLTRLVQQVIELSRLQGDEPLESPAPMSLDHVVRLAVDTSAIDADAKRISVVTGGETGLRVLGNEEQVTTAVSNLVANAVHYSEPDSTVLVTSKGIDGFVEISVVDQGIGIPRVEIDRIFERFYRVDPARHRSTGGTGLGLSIVKHVAATHGGDVRVWSVEGQGSTFTLTLPRSETPPTQDHPDETRPCPPNARRNTHEQRTPPSAAHRGPPMTRVLVVEDEVSYSEALAYMLRKEGFEVAIAADGNAALSEFDRNGADIVLLDLMLPGISGTEVCRTIRQTSNVPVIMVSAKDDEIDKIVGLELGADDYVTKPYSPRELVARIRAVLRRGQDPDLLPDTLEAGPVRMDVERHVVTLDGVEQRLPLKEFELLEMFLRNPGRVLTRGQLIDRVWGSDYVGDTKTLDVHVKRLRAKLEADPSEPKLLVTVRGLGYKLDL